MSDYRDINSLNTTPTALITGGDKVPFYNTGDAYAYAMTLDQLQSWVLSGGTIDPTFDDVSADTVTITGTTGNTLVVDTNTFVVDAANNRVGVGTVTPSSGVEVSNGAVRISSNESSVSLFLQTAMRHTGTGGFFLDLNSGGAANTFEIRNGSGFTTQVTLSASGNLGLGVTPSASSARTLQFPDGVTVSNAGTAASFAHNAVFNSGWKYVGTGAATLYQKYLGGHAWFTAPSGTAGNAITFTQAMTLSAAGGLSVGTTQDAGAGNISTGGDFRLLNSYSRVADLGGGGDFGGGYNFVLDAGTPKHDSTGNIAGYWYRNTGAIDFYTGGSQAAGTTAVVRWTINSSGHIIAGADGSYDIGASGANRPRNVFVSGTGTFGGALTATSEIRTSNLAITSGANVLRSFWYSGASGIMALGNASGNAGGAIELAKDTAPAAPATNNVRIYAEDNGSGKTRLMARFATGAAVQIAIEP